MENGELINIVGQSCRPDQEAKLTKWYEEVHIPGLLKFDGIKRVHCCQRVVAGKTQYDTPEENYPQFVNIYEYKSPQAFAEYEKWRLESSPVGKDVNAMWANDPVRRIWRVQYKIVKVLER